MPNPFDTAPKDPFAEANAKPKPAPAAKSGVSVTSTSSGGAKAATAKAPEGNPWGKREGKPGSFLLSPRL